MLGRGRDETPLTDQTISRRHAELRRAGDTWELTDLGSANGTYVNGARLQKPTKLKHGDQIRLGNTLLVYAGDETVEQLSGAAIPRDLVTLDAGSVATDAAIMARAPSSGDSVALAGPDTAAAIKAWNVMRKLSEIIGSLLPPERQLARVMDVIFEEVDVDHGVILVRDEASGELLPEVVRFRTRNAGEPRDGKSIMASRTIINHVLQSRDGVLCSNVVADKRFGSGKSVQNLGMRSVICAPIVARDRVLGVIHLDSPVTRHTYTEHELKLITAIGHQAGLALENARLVQAHMQRERLAAAGETVAQLSHYVKNILQGMRGGAEILQRGLDGRDFGVTGQGWRILERNLDKSYALMLNMLAFSKPREPRFELLQVNKIVEDVVALVQKQVDDARGVLLTDLDDGLPPIPVDYDGLHQVVLNLVTNAIDAVEPGRGIINLRSRYDADRREVLITVADNGPGVPSELRARIFEPFYSSKGHGGTGLGLPVARKIMTEMRGTLELVSPPEGGAQFLVHLPVSPTEAPAAEDTLGPQT